MTDIARLAQQPLQRSMPGASHCFRIPYSHITVTRLLIYLYSAGKDGSPSPSSAVTNISVQYVLSHTWNPADLFSRYAQARSWNRINVFTINFRTRLHCSPCCCAASSFNLASISILVCDAHSVCDTHSLLSFPFCLYQRADRAADRDALLPCEQPHRPPLHTVHSRRGTRL
jgi:hypothetical protein